MLQLVILLGLILSIVGGTDNTTLSTGKVESTTKAGAILYLVAYVGIVVVLLLSVPHTGSVPKRERMIPVSQLAHCLSVGESESTC